MYAEVLGVAVQTCEGNAVTLVSVLLSLSQPDGDRIISLSLLEYTILSTHIAILVLISSELMSSIIYSVDLFTTQLQTSILEESFATLLKETLVAWRQASSVTDPLSSMQVLHWSRFYQECLSCSTIGSLSYIFLQCNRVHADQPIYWCAGTHTVQPQKRK